MTPLFRWLGRALLVCYVLIVIVVLGVRYWLIPHIDDWREPIAKALSAATQSEIEIGRLSAQWNDVLPEIHVHDLYVHEAQQQSLHFPYVKARFKWRSALAGQVHFSYLRVDGLQLALWRDQNQQLHLAGKTVGFEDNKEQDGSHSGFIHWLGQQDQIEIQNAHLVWHDESRQAPPLSVTGLHGVLQRSEQSLQFNLEATPQLGLGKKMQLRGHLRQEALDQGELEGVLYVQLNELSPAAWQQWVDLPTDLTEATTLDTQLWLQMKDSQIRDLSMDLRVYNGVWQSSELGHIEAKYLRFFTTGPWESFRAVADEVPLAQRLQSDSFRLELYAKDVVLRNQEGFNQDLRADRLELIAKRDPTQTTIALQKLLWHNSDVQAQLHGTWTPHGADLTQGEWDVQGELNQLKLNALYQYFPTPAISDTAVSWLQHGLLDGTVPTAVLRLKGRLAQFPYADPKTGLFYIGGAFKQADIDYYPTTAKEKGWPKIEQASGYVMLKGNSLWVNADQALLKPNTKDAVQATQVQVHIDDFSAAEPQLLVNAKTAGPAQAYLGLMTHTDLGSWLYHTFDASSATGSWQVPLDLRFNLENENDLEVKGYIQFDDNSVQLVDFLPPLEQVKGRLHFSDQGARADQITARWLGGAIQLSQQIGQPGELLHVKGKTTTEAWAQYMETPALRELLSGQTTYQAQIGFDKKNQFFVSLQSELQGLALHLPKPLNKAAEQSLPFRLQWQALNKKQHQLTAQIDERLKLRLIENPQKTPFFSRGSLAWRQPLRDLPLQGMTVDLRHKELDLEAWQALMRQFNQSESDESNTIFPDLVRLRLKADKGQLWGAQLNQLTYTLQQPKAQHWRADISSEQVAGTIHWREDQQGKVQGEVQAALQRLHWQRQPSQVENNETIAELSAVAGAEDSKATLPESFTLRLPDVRLSINDLRIDTWRLGRLELHGQVKEKPDVWHIPALHLTTPSGGLHATGTWRLAGAQRGLGLSVQVQSDQVGDMLNFIGVKDMLKQGTGSAQAQIQWDHFPWQTGLQQLRADVDLSVHHGRINQINSRAAKMLELLSLQSLSRLSKLDFDVRGLAQDGFPFDDIKGRLRLSDQTLSTDNLRVIGPAGTIMLEGNTNMKTELLDMSAVVVPNVDMSGAAIAAGIALNPVVGIGAFLTQLLFKAPLAKAMTVQYQVTGPWDKLQTEEVKLSPQEPSEPQAFN